MLGGCRKESGVIGDDFKDGEGFLADHVDPVIEFLFGDVRLVLINFDCEVDEIAKDALAGFVGD